MSTVPRAVAPQAFVVPAGSEPQRLDVFLARTLPGGSRQRVRELLVAGAVRVNGRRRPKSALVHTGDVIEVLGAEGPTPGTLAANPNLAINILYADDDLVVLDKPSGMPSHALRLSETDTVANFLLARYPELRAVGKDEREAGLVHRLDTGTSGVLLGGRTAAAYAALRAQFSAQTVIKEYVALVTGDVAAAGEVATPIAHDRRHRRRMRVGTDTGSGDARSARAALTRYRPLQRFADCTLLAVEIPTGVMHQIRVHLASIGHPIVGDTLYGGRVAARPMLHAQRITFSHPRTGERMRLESPLPADMAAQLQSLRRGRQGRPERTGVRARRPRREGRR